MIPLDPQQQGKLRVTNAGAPSVKRAFTLVELLVVVGVIALMMTLAVPAFNSIGGGNAFSSEVYNVANTLREARAYAMANNTYVLAGIMEVSSAANNLSTAQMSPGAGTVVIALVASNAGIRPYTAQTLSNWIADYGSGNSYFTAISKLTTFNNLHLLDLQTGNPPVPGSGNMMRPPVSSAGCDIPSVSGAAANVFGWPLGKTYAAAQYPFTKVIEFDPQGSVRVIASASDFNSIPPEIEIGLQPIHGNVAPPVPTNQNFGQLAAIQIDGITGVTHIYRP